MATKAIVLGELGDVVVQAAKVVKKPGTPTQERERWMQVLVEASQAYAAVAKTGEKAGK